MSSEKMPDDPYQPPKSDLNDPNQPRGKPRWQAVAIGLAVDIGGSLVFGLLSLLAYSAYLAGSGDAAIDASELEARFRASDLYPASMVVGTFFSVLGGYVCARLARRDEYGLGVVQGILSVAIGYLLSFDDHDSTLETALLLFITLVATIGGAHVGARRNGHAVERH